MSCNNLFFVSKPYNVSYTKTNVHLYVYVSVLLMFQYNFGNLKKRPIIVAKVKEESLKDIKGLKDGFFLERKR